MMQILIYLFACWLLADFLSGFWHWAEDRYFRIEWPWIGKFIAQPNELHHEKPTAFLGSSYWQRNWTTILPAVVLFLITFPSPWSLAFLFLSQANEIHAWGHVRCNRWIRMLQEIGLLQSPAHHARHHKSPFAVRYCVMSNWLNPVLDELRVWRLFEWCLALFGIHPKPSVAT